MKSVLVMPDSDPEGLFFSISTKIALIDTICVSEETSTYYNGTICLPMCYKSCICYNSKTTKVNLIKLHKKVKHNKKVCHLNKSASHNQGHNPRSYRQIVCLL